MIVTAQTTDWWLPRECDKPEWKITANRVWAMPNRFTFKIPPIRALLYKYGKDGKNWADPFAGRSTFAEFRNDLNGLHGQRSNLEALEFMRKMENLAGVVFDPPYSLIQVSRSYEEIGHKFKSKENPTGGFPAVRDEISRAVRPGGFCISFGWNTNGMGKKRKWKIIEILIVAHGGNRNDTLCTVEQKH